MKFYRSILSLGLSALVLISSSSFIVGLHFCGGEIQNIALFTKADGCEKEKQLPPCHRHETPACCDDDTVVHEGQDLKNSVTGINFFSPFITEIGSSAIVIAEIIANQIDPENYADYDPPLRARDLTISLQVFLI